MRKMYLFSFFIICVIVGMTAFLFWINKPTGISQTVKDRTGVNEAILMYVANEKIVPESINDLVKEGYLPRPPRENRYIIENTDTAVILHELNTDGDTIFSAVSFSLLDFPLEESNQVEE